MPENEIRKFEKILRSKLNDLSVSLIVYGPYNAGKSTLINALLGKEVCTMGDIPTTSEPQEVLWGSWKVYDTPGIDAPIVHQDIANAKLAECECVLFIISSDSDFESDEIHKRLAEIANSGKACIIVCNDKTRILSQGNGKALARIMEKINFNIDKIWRKQASQGTKPYIMIVNAKRALNARLKSSRELEAASNISQLELQLAETLTNTDIKAISANLARNVALEKVQKLKLILEGSISDQETVVLENMREETITEMKRIEFDCEMLTNNFLNSVQERIAGAMKCRQSKSIETILQQEANELVEVLETRLKREFSKSHEHWNAKDICLIKNAGMSISQIHPIPDNSQTPLPHTSGLSDKTLSSLKYIPEGEVEKLASPAIKELLLKMREWKLPGIKGKWESTLAKWAGNTGKVLAKALPVVITLGETFLAYQQQKEYEQALEAREKEIHSVSQNIVIRLKETILNNVFDAIKEFFTDRINTINNALNECESNNKFILEALERLGNIKAELETIAAYK